jgi:hypothetical protein
VDINVVAYRIVHKKHLIVLHLRFRTDFGISIRRRLLRLVSTFVPWISITAASGFYFVPWKVGKCDLIMVHVRINDLKSQSVETVFPKFVELINEAKSKENEVLMSMLTPV